MKFVIFFPKPIIILQNRQTFWKIGGFLLQIGEHFKKYRNFLIIDELFSNLMNFFKFNELVSKWMDFFKSEYFSNLINLFQILRIVFFKLNDFFLKLMICFQFHQLFKIRVVFSKKWTFSNWWCFLKFVEIQIWFTFIFENKSCFSK